MGLKRFIRNLKAKKAQKLAAKELQKLQNRVEASKFVHLMFNDKFGKPFVDFLNANFDTKDHLVLCKKWFEFPFPQGENVVDISRYEGLDFSKNDKVICHSLFDGELIDYLYAHKDTLQQRAYWCIWGGDLYEPIKDEKNDFVRENFRGYISDVDGDIDVLQQKYSIKNKFFYRATYTFPVTMDIINNAKSLLNSTTPPQAR